MTNTKITHIAAGASGVTHSPGPWIADDLFEEEGHRIRVGTSDGTSLYYQTTKTICICHAPDDLDDPRAGNDEEDIPLLTQMANARLIAAAPLMLEALKALLPEGWGDDDTMDHIPGVKQARAAILAATGATP